MSVLLRSIALLACFVAAQAHAQGNDLMAPTGGRATLMGNTGVALGRDGSAPFYNPATIVGIRDQRLAFSVNFYSLGLSHFDGWHQPGNVDSEQFGDRNLGGTGLLQTSFHSLPSTLCLFFTLQDLAKLSPLGGGDNRDKEPDDRRPTGKKLAVCFASLESEDFDLQAIHFRAETAAGPTAQVQSLQRRWVRTYVGPTYSVSLSDRFAVGGSLQVVYTATSFGLNSTSLNSRMGGGGVSSTLGTSGSGRSFELTGVLGATYQLDRWTLGASFRPPSLHVLGSYQGTYHQGYTGDMDVSVIADAEGSMRSAPPARLALGAGYSADRWTLEIDTALELPFQDLLRTGLDVVQSTLQGDGVDVQTQRQNYRVQSHFTVNPSIGLEYFLSSGLSLLTGLSTNLTSLGTLRPKESVGNIIQARTNHISASLGVGSYWNRGELLFGLQLDYGWGQALAMNPYVIPNAWSVVGTEIYSILFVIAGSTNLNSLVHMMKSIANGGEVADDNKGDKGANPKGSDER